VRQKLFRDERGSVAIIVALMMLIVFGAAGFAFDFGRFYLTQNRDQMAADAAAFSAALAYGSTSSSSTAAAQACVTAAQNGVAITCPGSTGTTASITTTIGPSPTNSSQMAAHVIVHSTMQLSAFGALVQRSGNTLPVNAEAWAMINAGAPPCLIALSPEGGPTAIGFSGSAEINAPSCAVAAGGPISLPGATKLIAQAATTGDTIELSGSGSVTAPLQQQHFSFSPVASTPPNPFANSSVATTGFSRLTTVSGYTAASTNPLPTAPSGGSNSTPTCSGGVGSVASATYKNLTLTGSNCVFTVLGPIAVSGTLTIGDSSGNVGNVTVIFPNNGTYDINAIANGAQGGLIQTTGSTFNVYTGVSTIANASELSLGCSARFNVTVSGQTYLGCSGSDPDTNTYNIQNSITTQGATLAFGNGNFTISGGVKLNGGASCAAANTLQFGNGSSFILTDTGITLAGGCFIFGSATNHDINAGGAGNAAISNSSGTTVLTFGSGTYTLNGGFTLAGASTSSGTNMTLVSSGVVNVEAGANVSWSAPPSAPFLVATNSSASPAVTLSGGSGNTLFDGIVYAPNGNVDLAGSAAINANPPVTTPPFCFTLVANTISLSGGTSAANACPGSGTGFNLNTVMLVQ
jgi:Flp pilus assembly protein TadG